MLLPARLDLLHVRALIAVFIGTPGLTLVVVVQAFRPASRGLAATVVTGVASSVLALWFKGAIVAFYLRQNPPPQR